MTASKRRVTSADVARVSGVSRSTVSFVLNDTPSQSIPESTRARVLAAARDLGYVRSPTAVALARGRTDTVILDLGSLPFSDYQVGEFASAFSAALERVGATVVVHSARDDGADALIRLARAIQPFAVASFDPRLSESAEELENAGVQTIQSIDFAGDGAVDWMEESAALQISHLRSGGRSHLAFVTAAGLSGAAGPRKAAVTTARARHDGMSVSTGFEVGDDRGVNRATVMAWRADNPDVDSLICFNDDTAFAALAALQDLRIDVPGHVAIIGADDIPNARFSTPPLTTLRADVARGAAHLATSLLATLGHPQPNTATQPLFELIVRESA